MTNTPPLRLYMPPSVGTGFVEDFTKRADRYRHRTIADGGYWMADWWMPLAPRRGLTADYLRHWFDARLMYLLREQPSGTTWEGVIWKMELNLDGLRKARSMDGVWNAVKVAYTDEAGQTQYTSWYTHAASIDRFGRRELIQTVSGLTSTQAAAEAQRILSQNLWATPVTAGVDIEDEGLLVTAAGLVRTANNKYVGSTTLDGTSKSLDTLISDIITNDCEFLDTAVIEANTLTRTAMTEQPMRAWELMQEICEASDGSNLPRFVQVYNNARMRYVTPNTTPKYRWYGKQKKFGDAVGGRVLWQAAPGVMRDLTGEPGAAAPGSWLDDRRDTWIEEVEAAVGMEIPILKPAEPDPEAILRAKEKVARWLELEATDA